MGSRFARGLGRTMFWCIVAVFAAWAVGGLIFLNHWIPNAVSQGLGWAGLFAFVMFATRRATRKHALMGLAIVVLGLFAFYQTRTPSHDRIWTVGQELMSTADIHEDTVSLSNIRDFEYGDDGSVVVNYRAETFDLAQINSVWFGVDRFTDVEPVAHTFLSFGFKESVDSPEEFVAFSVETRREASEGDYSPFKGIYNHYELIYVVATERDMLMQRANVLAHPVQLYPMRAEKEQMQAMFLDIIHRINSVAETPEFYHTLRSNCTNNIVAHANHVGPNPINMWQRGVIFPGYSDWLAYRYQLIDTELTLEGAREQFRIDQRTSQWNGQGNFSSFIRERD